MRILDFINMFDCDTHLCIHMDFIGVDFVSRHPRDYFRSLKDKTLLEKELQKIYVSDNELHLVVKQESINREKLSCDDIFYTETKNE